jgi:hypothetical protein
MDLTKLKPFDRQAAKEGAKLVTRVGKKVIYYHDTGLDIEYPIIAFIKGDLHIKSFGVFGQRDIIVNRDDLFIAPQTREYWAFKYRDERGIIRLANTYCSKEDALGHMDNMKSLYRLYEIVGEPFCFHIEEI